MPSIIYISTKYNIIIQLYFVIFLTNEYFEVMAYLYKLN